MKFIVGSESEIKFASVDAARRTLALAGVTIYTCPAKSGVSAQPFGQEETERGARNRARAGWKPGAYGIGIENGIRPTADGYEDWPVVAVVRPDGTEVLLDGAAVPVPAEIVEAARARGFETTTVGQILAERFGLNPNDPHPFLTNGTASRLSILSAAVTAALTLAFNNHAR